MGVAQPIRKTCWTQSAGKGNSSQLTRTSYNTTTPRWQSLTSESWPKSIKLTWNSSDMTQKYSFKWAQTREAHNVIKIKIRYLHIQLFCAKIQRFHAAENIPCLLVV